MQWTSPDSDAHGCCRKCSAAGSRQQAAAEDACNGGACQLAVETLVHSHMHALV